MSALDNWAIRNNISMVALMDLRFTLTTTEFTESFVRGDKESDVQDMVRIEAAKKGSILWRNNVGAGKLENGKFVRWGLANDSKVMNETCKSSDLIGIRPVLITPEHVGKTVGQFVAYEVKRPGWVFSNQDREKAQNRFQQIVIAKGGHAAFVTSEKVISS